MLSEIKKLYEYREMLKNTVKKELRARYKGSVLGFLWTFLNPLLTLIVFSIVFSKVMRVSIPNYSYTVFLFVGLIPWTYCSATISQSTTIIVTNSNLIKKVYFPRVLLPISITATNLINMLLSFIIVFAALFFSGSKVNIWYIYLPIIILLQTILTLGISLMISSITVYFRDLEHIMSIVVMAWFYLTPIVYTNDYIPKELFTAFKMNPMMFIIDSYRDILMFSKQPETSGVLYVFMLSLIFLVCGYITFNILQRRFAEEV